MTNEQNHIPATVNNTVATIIFTHGGGRFGNQMLSYAQLLAFALEHQDIDFINMACWEYADLLAAGEKNSICAYSSSKNKYLFFDFLYFLCKVLFIKNDSIAKSFIIHILFLFGGNSLAKYYNTQSILVKKEWATENLLLANKLANLDLAKPESFVMISSTKTTFLSGWNICDWNLVRKHQKEIRSNLQIHHKYKNVSNIFIAEKRKKYDFLIGVMIRQGDYKLWKGGQYYFSIEQYSYWIDQLSELYQNRGKVGFIMASDSPQDLNNFANQNIHFTTGIANSAGHYIESISQLSLCDIIMSPPSSFSLWAAFLGNIPFIPLSDTKQLMITEQSITKTFFDCIENIY